MEAAAICACQQDFQIRDNYRTWLLAAVSKDLDKLFKVYDTTVESLHCNQVAI